MRIFSKSTHISESNRPGDTHHFLRRDPLWRSSRKTQKWIALTRDGLNLKTFPKEICKPKRLLSPIAVTVMQLTATTEYAVPIFRLNRDAWLRCSLAMQCVWQCMHCSRPLHRLSRLLVRTIQPMGHAMTPSDLFSHKLVWRESLLEMGARDGLLRRGWPVTSKRLWHFAFMAIWLNEICSNL